MPRILHCRSASGGRRRIAWIESKLRRRELDQLLEKAVDYALSPQNKIHAVLIVGDLFEHYCPDGPPGDASHGANSPPGAKPGCLWLRYRAIMMK